MWAASVVTKFPGLTPVYAEENLGQRLAFRMLSDQCINQTYMMVVEEDFLLTAPNATVVDSQLEVGVKLLERGTANAVWMRSRQRPGEPLFEKIQFDRGRLGPR